METGSRIEFFLIWLVLFLATTLFALTFPIVWAKADEPAPNGLSLAGININGRFDLNLESEKFTGNPSEGEESLKNYHHFVFLSRKKESEPFSFTAEVIDLTFYEMAAKIGETRQVRFGKILVPFGSDPLFHHAYGGLSGFDQKLVPFIWTELGAAYQYSIARSKTYRLQNEFAVVSGLTSKTPDDLAINVQGDPSNPALVDRFGYGRDKYSAWLSLYWDQHHGGNNLFMYGGDIAAAYGFLPWGALRNLSAKAGFLRADVQNKDGENYYHFGDYFQMDCRLPAGLLLRYRGGFIALDNQEGWYFDQDRENNEDRLGHNLGLWWSHKLLSVGATYYLNIERANEEPNDLIRVTAVLEF